MPKSVPGTPSAATPAAPYSVATEANGFVILSGQVATIPATGGRASDDIVEQTHQVMRNIGAVLGDVGLGYDDVVKTTVFLGDMGDYAVVNEVYGSYFPGQPPARSAVQVAGLPGGFLIEIEVVAAR